MRRLTPLGLAALAGCATALNPGPDLVPISTRPNGAEVFLDGRHVGRTPLVLPLPRDSRGELRFERRGYAVAHVDLDKVLNGATFMNLAWVFVWPAVPLGFLIDAATGHIGKYPTAHLDVELTREGR